MIDRKWIIALGAGVAGAISGSLIVFVARGLNEQWGNAQFGNLATWVTGGLTLAGLFVALDQSARAASVAADAKAATDTQLVRAEQDRIVASERLKTDRIEFERRRRVDIEISHRLRYLDAVRRIMTEMTEQTMHFADHSEELLLALNDGLSTNDALKLHGRYWTSWGNGKTRIKADCFTLRGAGLDQTVLEMLDDLDEVIDFNSAIKKRDYLEILKRSEQWETAVKPQREFETTASHRCDVDLAVVEKFIDETWQVPLADC